MTTIREVAEQAQVSVSTVSHVINRTRFVDSETQERVRQAISTLGYRPNLLARSLRRRETRTIGLLVPDNANPYFAEFARVIEEERRGSDLAGRMGGDEFAVVLIHSSPSAADRFLERLRSRAAEFGSMSFSAGAAHAPADGSAADALFRVADARLYDAKR